MAFALGFACVSFVGEHPVQNTRRPTYPECIGIAKDELGSRLPLAALISIGYEPDRTVSAVENDS